jgi:hypothetical protein
MKTNFILFLLFLVSANLFSQAWDGSVTTWTVGDGLSAETAYEISTPAHLAYLAQQVNAGTTYENQYFKMTTNLDLDGLNSRQWIRIGSSATSPFKGIFDGGGNAILNIFINRIGSSSPNDGIQGLFGYVDGGTIQNLGINSGFVSGLANIGVIVGILNNGTVQNCYNHATVETSRGQGAHGGLVGKMESGTIRYCYNAGDVMKIRGVNNNNVGGIVGWSVDGAIEFCFNVGSVSGANGVGGIVGSGENASINNCYNTGTIKGKLNSGGIVGITAGTKSPEIEKCYSTGFMDISEVTGNYGAILGASNIRPVNNSFYDVQLITSSLIMKGLPRLTSLMLGDGIRSSLGDDNWEYASGFYPALKNNNTSDAAKLSIAPMVLDADDDADGVVSNFTVETSTGVLWSSSDETGIDISGSNAMVLRKQTDQNIIVTATYGSLSKSYNLFIPLDPSTAVNNVKNQLSVKLNGKVLEIHGDLMNNSKLTIYDLTGSVVVSQYVRDNNVMSVANLSKGVYILAAVSSDGIASTHKFLIQ